MVEYASDILRCVTLREVPLYAENTCCKHLQQDKVNLLAHDIFDITVYYLIQKARLFGAYTIAY